jgi:hypothetical protein
MVSSVAYVLELYSLYHVYFFPVTAWAEISLARQRNENGAHLCGAVHVSFPCRSRSVPWAHIWDRWEYVTTVDFEWEVYTGRRPWRWSFVVYLLARVFALIAIILSLMGLNVTREYNCDVLLLVMCC